MFKRKGTRKLNIGGVTIGGGSPIAVQSMTNTDTHDVKATVAQIKRLEAAGCEIVRVAVPDMDAAQKLGLIKKKISIPLVADIHFDYRLALEALKQGVDKLRINPGNIGDPYKVEEIVSAALKTKTPIRIGVNAGSLKAARGVHDVKLKARKLAAAAALEHCEILEKYKFYDIAVSLKASDVLTTVEAYREFAAARNYPLHLGITEAGGIFRGTVKSSVGLGIMLAEGLGDTVRVSLTSDPEEEVRVAYQILQSLELRSTGIDVISCPTCSRCEVDLIKIVEKLEQRLAKIIPHTRKNKVPLKIAVMGCAVNGPGEACEADIGIAGGKNTGLLFAKGKVIGKVPPAKWVDTIIKMVLKTTKR